MACLPSPMIVTVAKTKPMKSEPASPRKMRAGLKLYGRKPSAEPASAIMTSATTGLVCRIEITKMTAAEIVVTPASRPSSPSMKLMAFIIPTYQTSVSGTPTYHGNSIQLVLGSWLNGLVVPSMTNPYIIAIDATTICARSLLRGRIPMMSSHSPTPRISSPPNSSPTTLRALSY